MPIVCTCLLSLVGCGRHLVTYSHKLLAYCPHLAGYSNNLVAYVHCLLIYLDPLVGNSPFLGRSFLEYFLATIYLKSICKTPDILLYCKLQIAWLRFWEGNLDKNVYLFEFKDAFDPRIFTSINIITSKSSKASDIEPFP